MRDLRCLSRRGSGIRLTVSMAFLVVLSCLLGCHATDRHIASQGVSTSIPAGPRVALDQATCDAGSIRPNSTCEAVFHVSNAGGETLRITGVEKCCGTVTKLGQGELAPGEATELIVQCHVGSAPSTLNKRVTLVTNDPDQPRIPLIVVGQVAETLAWGPERFELAEYEDKVVCPEIWVRSLDGKPFAVTGFSSTAGVLHADFDAAVKATEFRLKPVVDMARLQAMTTRTGTVKVLLEGTDYESIPVGFTVVPSLEAVPARVLVFNAWADRPISASLEVKDHRLGSADAAVEVESVQVKSGARLEVRTLASQKDSCRIQLELVAVAQDSAKGKSFASDELLVKLKDGRQLTVPLLVFHAKPVAGVGKDTDGHL